MLSVRYKGANVPTIVGYNLGNVAKQVMRVFAVILLLLVGVVFVAAPAGLLAKLTPDYMDQMFWVAVIFAYYFLATILPIDKIIGRLYPLFGAVLIIMAVGMTVTMFTNGCEFYNWASFPNNHPQQLPIFPLVFITIACGALSGFHATQSPLMSRCLSNESVFGNSFINNETFQQYACHGYLSHGLRHIKASLVIPHKTPPANQPAECSFNYPTLRHWLKACLPWCAFHDFHNKSKIGGLVHQ